MSLRALRRRWFAWPWELHARGVVGINERNADWLLPLNPRRHYLRVDDKLATKMLVRPLGIPVPDTYGVIRRYGDLQHLDAIVAEHPDFVIKPSRGCEGRGILVIGRHGEGVFHTSSRGRYQEAEMRHHASSILSGLYSLGGRPDKAILEQRILPHPVFAPVSVGGTPDVRILVCMGIPVMAMLRLPTAASRGRANLYQGAVGAGLSLEAGVAAGGVQWDRAITVHPDTGVPIAGLQVPSWPRILATAARIHDVLGLGYYGADFVLDQDLRPVLLEANARPGLAVQIANRCGLRRRLELAHEHAGTCVSLEARLACVPAMSRIG